MYVEKIIPTKSAAASLSISSMIAGAGTNGSGITAGSETFSMSPITSDEVSFEGASGVSFRALRSGLKSDKICSSLLAAAGSPWLPSLCEAAEGACVFAAALAGAAEEKSYLNCVPVFVSSSSLVAIPPKESPASPFLLSASFMP